MKLKNYTKKTFEKNIKEYIDKNKYLFLTDDSYTINCHLKPRLVANAVSESCNICKNKKLFLNFNESIFEEVFNYGIIFAIDYINKINIKKGEDYVYFRT